jgi:lysophospholipase L1-like esterase
MQLKKNILLLFLMTISYGLPVIAQTTKWWNPATNAFPVISGQAWPAEVAEPYDRLPARAEKDVTKNVWYLSHQSAGLAIRFSSNAPSITVRYKVKGEFAMPHMPSTGVSGVDLYAINKHGGWEWTAGGYSFKDTVTYQFVNLGTASREYRLFLPLYNNVSWMEIGVPDNASFTPIPLRKEKPIVIYGTSIAQGGCASRPGLAWTGMLERRMDREVINLGFSGNGQLDPPVINLLTEIDAKIYVLDCLPNLSGGSFTPEIVKERLINAVQTLRKKRPNTPILLAAHSGESVHSLNTDLEKTFSTINKTLTETYAELKAKKIPGLYILTEAEMNLGSEGTVDGVHPNDIGMDRYAIAYEKSIRKILEETVDTAYSTTQPCRQNRDAPAYDWETRHNELLTANKASAPKVVFIGNSITHFWGGEPKSTIVRGESSWQQVLAPLGARNFGFGNDRIENVLWRIYHDELDGYDASQIVILIGTNNLSVNTDKEIIAGLKLLVTGIQKRQPKAKILLSGILPRKDMEARVKTVNKGIAMLAKPLGVTYIQPGQVFLKPDGKIDARLFSDGLHPNEAGYQQLANYLAPLLKSK